MTDNLLSENECRKAVARWMLANKRNVCLLPGQTPEDFADSFEMPQIIYRHTDSYADANGDLVTMLKGEIALSDWETKNGTEPKTLTVYKVLKTSLTNPDVEPFPAGYIVIE